jgi:hypothetical protein
MGTLALRTVRLINQRSVTALGVARLLMTSNRTAVASISYLPILELLQRLHLASKTLTLCGWLFGYGSVISTPAVWPGGISAYATRLPEDVPSRTVSSWERPHNANRPAPSL